MATIYRCDKCKKVLEPVEVFNRCYNFSGLKIDIRIADKIGYQRQYCRDCVIELIIAIDIKTS